MFAKRVYTLGLVTADMDARTRIVVVDDHPIIREGLRRIIDSESDMAVVGEAKDCPDALRVIAALQPDLALVDLSLKESSGLELIKDIRLRNPKVLVLVLSMYDESFYAERVLRAGGRGYIVKEEAAETILAGVRRVMAGEIFLSRNMARKMLAKMVAGRGHDEGLSMENLSDRELEVFGLIGQGLSTRQIARQLHLSVKTVGSHRAHVKEKLQLRTGPDLLRHAIQWAQSCSGASAVLPPPSPFRPPVSSPASHVSTSTSVRLREPQGMA